LENDWFLKNLLLESNLRVNFITAEAAEDEDFQT